MKNIGELDIDKKIDYLNPNVAAITNLGNNFINSKHYIDIESNISPVLNQPLTNSDIFIVDNIFSKNGNAINNFVYTEDTPLNDIISGDYKSLESLPYCNINPDIGFSVTAEHNKSQNPFLVEDNFDVSNVLSINQDLSYNNLADKQNLAFITTSNINETIDSWKTPSFFDSLSDINRMPNFGRNDFFKLNDHSMNLGSLSCNLGALLKAENNIQISDISNQIGHSNIDNFISLDKDYHKPVPTIFHKDNLFVMKPEDSYLGCNEIDSKLQEYNTKLVLGIHNQETSIDSNIYSTQTSNLSFFTQDNIDVKEKKLEITIESFSSIIENQMVNKGKDAFIKFADIFINFAKTYFPSETREIIYNSGIDERYIAEKSKGGENSYKKYKPLREKVRVLCKEEIDNSNYGSALGLCEVVSYQIEKNFPELLENFEPYQIHSEDGGGWTKPTFYNWCNKYFKQYNS